MAGLYDRIRKTKLKNLEAVLEAEQARSMAEAVAKFKNVNSQSAYGGGEALADPAAALGGGKQIKETSQDNPCEPDGAGGMINKNTGKPCKSLEEMTESDPDVNPDADEDGGGLFGRKKGGTKIGNFLRNIVGKKSYELMDADPFSSAINFPHLSFSLFHLSQASGPFSAIYSSEQASWNFFFFGSCIS